VTQTECQTAIEVGGLLELSFWQVPHVEDMTRLPNSLHAKIHLWLKNITSVHCVFQHSLDSIDLTDKWYKTVCLLSWWFHMLVS